MSAGKSARKAEMIYKTTDFRRELAYREKKVAEIKREKMKILADIRPVPKFMVTLDLSHARGNMDALRICLKELEWKEYPFGRKDQNCDIHWHCTNFEQNLDVYSGKVNKFPGMSWICSKNNLFRVLDQMRNLYPDEYNFYPRTWYLPEQLHQLSCDIRKLNEKKVKPKPTFIVKPDEGSQGEGIYLIRDSQEYIYSGSNNNRNHVCQEYITNVFLIDRFKFDLRIYVVLKSIEPLEFYLCREGLARFSTVPYENPTNKNLHETFMHLTNYSLNKRSSTFNRSERDDEGSKRTLTSVLTRIERMGYKAELLWELIEELVAKTIIAIIPDLKIEMMAAVPAGKPGPSCFQILGFDILLLENLKPILLEINSSPSLRIDSEVEVAPGVVEYVPSPKDEEVKLPLIRDTLLLVAPQKKLKYLQRPWRLLESLPFTEMVVGLYYRLQVLDWSVAPIYRLKRRKARKEKRRMQKEATERYYREMEESRQPTQTELNGIIHVETNHPRSSIIIIRADDEDTKKPLPDEVRLISAGTNNRNNNSDEYEEGRNINEEIKLLTVEDINRTNNSMTAEDEEEKYREVHTESRNDDTDNSESEKSIDIYDKDNSCLKLLYPEPYDQYYDKLRMYEKLADVFLVCLGVRQNMRLGPTGFRTFARKCCLNRRGITNAAIDILYIDMQRKWEHVNPERTSGLPFRGFLDACHEIARRKFFDGDKLKMMDDFIEYCEINLREEQQYQARNMPRLPNRKARPHGYPLLTPMMPTLNVSDDTAEKLYVNKSQNLQQPKSANDVEAFLRRRGNLKPVKSSGKTRSKSRLKQDSEED